jgi:hypothetical protein
MLTAREIRELDLGPQRQEAAELGDVVGAAVGGNLLAVDPSVSEQHRQDVIQSLLFAQLVAGGKANRHTSPLEWYAAYQGALERLGWIVQASTATTRYLSPTPKTTVAGIVDNVLRPHVLPTDLALMRALIAAYRADAGGLAQLVFECPSHSGGLANLQVASAAEDDQAGDVVLRIVRVVFNAPTHVVRVMDAELTSDARVQTGFVAMTLDEAVFSKVRDALATRLADWLSSSVAFLQRP